MTKTDGLVLKAAELHVCNNQRHLLFALADALGRGVSAVILYLEDDIPLDSAMKTRLRGIDVRIQFLFSMDTVEMAAFMGLPWPVPDVLRRNLRPDGTGATRWRLPVLQGQSFATGYIYHPGFFASKPVAASCAHVVMRESGLNNYVSHPVSGLKSVLRAVSGLPARSQVWGEEPWVDAIEVAHPEKLPQRVRYKARKRGFADVYSALSALQIEQLSGIFVPDMPLIDSKNGPKALILTQPLDAVGLCTPAEKKQIYNQCVARLRKLGYCVYVKHHPTDVHFYVEDAHEVPAAFPIELWPALQLPRFDLAVALCSASLVEGEFLLAERVAQLMPPEGFNAVGCQALIADWPKALDALEL